MKRELRGHPDRSGDRGGDTDGASGPDGSSTAAARVARLEAALAHLERNYDELNSVVVAQSRALTRLQKRLDKLDETLKTQDTERLPPHNAKPPHYAP